MAVRRAFSQWLQGIGVANHPNELRRILDAVRPVVHIDPMPGTMIEPPSSSPIQVASADLIPNGTTRNGVAILARDVAGIDLVQRPQPGCYYWYNVQYPNAAGSGGNNVGMTQRPYNQVRMNAAAGRTYFRGGSPFEFHTVTDIAGLRRLNIGFSETSSATPSTPRNFLWWHMGVGSGGSPLSYGNGSTWIGPFWCQPNRLVEWATTNPTSASQTAIVNVIWREMPPADIRTELP